MNETENITIYDVAAAAGVAASTVSRTFTKPGRVSAKTATHVRKIAHELGYLSEPRVITNPRRTSHMLGLVLADATNPFFFQIIQGAQRAATERGYTLVLADIQESPTQERSSIDRLTDVVDGFFLATSRMSDVGVRMIAKQRPVVVLNRIVEQIPSVVTDMNRGMNQVLDHLARQGHHHILYLSGPQTSWADGARWMALRQNAARHSITVKRSAHYTPQVSGGRQAAAEYLEHHAKLHTAVVAYNDIMAIGFMQELTQRGINVPEYVSVVGVDDILGADWTNPQLTSLAAPLNTLGQLGIQDLIQQTTTGQSSFLRPKMVPTQLVVRQSTGPARRT